MEPIWMTEQEIFDKSVGGIVAQGAFGMEGEGADGTCRYLTREGHRCAAGQLIPAEKCFGLDGVVAPEAPADPVNVALVAAGVPRKSLGMVRQLQSIHDRVAFGRVDDDYTGIPGFVRLCNDRVAAPRGLTPYPAPEAP